MAGARVDGLSEAQYAFRSARDELADLGDTYMGIARDAAEVMRGFVPVRIGNLRDSIRPTSEAGQAVVTIGGPKAPHAHPLRATHPSRFVPRTDAVMERRAADALEHDWDQIAQRNGLST